MGQRNLRRSRQNKMLCGVCGGVGEYFNIDPTIVRLIWALLICFAGTGLLVYIICAIVIPEDNYMY